MTPGPTQMPPLSSPTVRRRTPALLAAAATAGALLLSACEAPPVVATADKRQGASLGRIDGNVVVTGTSRGNVIVLLYSVDNPPPPQGQGRPVSFTVVPENVVFPPGATGAGPFTAPYALSLVPPGRYHVRGFVDVRGCGQSPFNMVPACAQKEPDFIPWYNVTAEPNQGDVPGGALVNPLAPAPELRVITVGGQAEEDVDGDGVGDPAAASGVTVTFAEVTGGVIPSRPAFRVMNVNPTGPATEPATGNRFPSADPDKQHVLALQPEAIVGTSVLQAAPAFLARFTAFAPNNGPPLDLNGDTLPDVWPRLVLRKLADGEAGSIGTFSAEPHVLAGTVVPTKPFFMLDGSGNYVLDANNQRIPRRDTFPVTELMLAFRTVQLDVTDPSKPVPTGKPATGRYALVLMTSSGQTWRVPNELHPNYAAGMGLSPVASQGYIIVVD